MAFVVLLTSLLPIAVWAQSFPTNFPPPPTNFPAPPTGYPAPPTGYPAPPTGGYPSTSGAGGGSFPSNLGRIGFPGGNGPQRPRSPIGTMRAENHAGDKLALTLEEEYEDDNPLGGPFGQLGPFSQLLFQGNPFQRRLPGSRGTRRTKVRVRGYFIKAGAKTGITSQGSLHGTFAIVVMTNGNIAGSCVGTGTPYTPRRNRIGPFGSAGPYGSLFAPYLGQQGPFSQLSGISNTGAAYVSTPLQAKAGTASIDGTIKANMAELYGRSLCVCPDYKCTVKSDMCGAIVRDMMSVEDFIQYKKHLRATSTVPQPSSFLDLYDDGDNGHTLSGGGGGGGAFGGITGISGAGGAGGGGGGGGANLLSGSSTDLF
ncbi:uncharacterized protein LOC143295223 [Babylonia areolata]|uniref:uncharacterized protein LOC143295223 n=1 Tax=Babylonia areolata TaxID=304850 RepID=UPI003FCF618F